MVGCLGSGQVVSLFVHPHPLTFLMVKGVQRPSSGCQMGLPVFFLSLIPTPFLSIFMDPLAVYSRDGLRNAFKTSASSVYQEALCSQGLCIFVYVIGLVTGAALALS